MLAVPSIVAGTGSVGQVLEISSNSLSGTLLLKGRNLSGTSSFNPNVVAFSGASLPKDDSSGQLTTIANRLKAAYTGSDLAGASPVRELLATPAGGLAGLGAPSSGRSGGSAASTAAASALAGPVVSKFFAGTAHTCALTTAGESSAGDTTVPASSEGDAIESKISLLKLQSELSMAEAVPAQNLLDLALKVYGSYTQYQSMFVELETRTKYVLAMLQAIEGQ